MVHSEAADIVALAPGQERSAIALSREAGWNQTEADWRLFLDFGEVFAIEREGMLAATAAIMPYGTEFAWVSMVLTRKRFRGQGFGTALLKHCIARLEELGRVALLDATPLGEPLYKKLGFAPIEGWARWSGRQGGALSQRRIEDTASAIEMDRQAFGADRSKLLMHFVARSHFCLSTPDGSCFLRDGDRAWQIGPISASSPSAATRLLRAAIETLDGEVFVDVPDRAVEMTELLTGLGFARQRPFLRMARGEPPANATGFMHYALAGPELG